MLTISCFWLSRHLSCFLLLPMLLPTTFSLRNYAKKKEEDPGNWFYFSILIIVFQLVFFLLFSLHCLFFSYDLPPFLATLVLVFLLAEASPFLLDFFLVAIISRSFMYTLLLMIYLVRLDLWSFQFNRVILRISYATVKH